MAQKCLCGVELEVIKKGRVLRCPVEGITYIYPPSNPPEIEKALAMNGLPYKNRKNKSSPTAHPDSARGTPNW